MGRFVQRAAGLVGAAALSATVALLVSGTRRDPSQAAWRELSGPELR